MEADPHRYVLLIMMIAAILFSGYVATEAMYILAVTDYCGACPAQALLAAYHPLTSCCALIYSATLNCPSLFRVRPISAAASTTAGCQSTLPASGPPMMVKRVPVPSPS